MSHFYTLGLICIHRITILIFANGDTKTRAIKYRIKYILYKSLNLIMCFDAKAKVLFVSSCCPAYIFVLVSFCEQL